MAATHPQLFRGWGMQSRSLVVEEKLLHTAEWAESVSSNGHGDSIAVPEVVSNVADVGFHAAVVWQMGCFVAAREPLHCVVSSVSSSTAHGHSVD